MGKADNQEHNGIGTVLSGVTDYGTQNAVLQCKGGDCGQKHMTTRRQVVTNALLVAKL